VLPIVTKLILECSFNIITTLICSKTRIKEYVSSIKKLAERIPQYKGRWAKSMNEQIPDLPDFEQVERETLRHLKSILKR